MSSSEKSDSDSGIVDSEVIAVKTWKPPKEIQIWGIKHLSAHRMAIDYRDYRIPCTCTDRDCPQLSPIAYTQILRHPEFRGPGWMRIKDPGDTSRMYGKYQNFTKYLHKFKVMVEDWDYYSHIPKTGKAAFVKLLRQTMDIDRHVIITSERAEQLWEMCPAKYQMRFELAARARVEHEVQEDVLLHLQRFWYEWKEELDGVPVGEHYRRYLHSAHEGNFLMNSDHNVEDKFLWK